MELVWTFKHGKGKSLSFLSLLWTVTDHVNSLVAPEPLKTRVDFECQLELDVIVIVIAIAIAIGTWDWEWDVGFRNGIWDSGLGLGLRI